MDTQPMISYADMYECAATIFAFLLVAGILAWWADRKPRALPEPDRTTIRRDTRDIWEVGHGRHRHEDLFCPYCGEVLGDEGRAMCCGEVNQGVTLANLDRSWAGYEEAQ